MSTIWYYADGGQQVGPLTLQELKQTLLNIPMPHQVLVWCDTFSDWKRAEDVPELRAQTVVPPPLPEELLSQQKAVNENFSKRVRLSRAALYGFVFGAIAVILAAETNGLESWAYSVTEPSVLAYWIDLRGTGPIVFVLIGMPIVFVLIGMIMNLFKRQRPITRTFWAIVLAALAGLLLVRAAASISTRDDGSAMFLGLLGGAALMGALVAFRRPTEAERLAKEAKRRARREARLARQQESDHRANGEGKRNSANRYAKVETSLGFVVFIAICLWSLILTRYLIPEDSHSVSLPRQNDVSVAPNVDPTSQSPTASAVDSISQSPTASAVEPTSQSPTASAVDPATAQWLKDVASKQPQWLKNLYDASRRVMQANEDAPPLSGKVRADFIDGGLKTCFDEQRKEPINTALSETLQEYCHCYMNALADSISVRELKAIGKIGELPADLLGRAGNQCEGIALKLLHNPTPAR